MKERRRLARGRLAGKVALITGAGGNIGSEIARRFLSEGATIVMSGRDKLKLETVKNALRDELRVSSARIVLLPMNAAEPGQVRAAIADVLTKVGRIDVLVNNAGTAGPKCRLQDLPLLPANIDGCFSICCSNCSLRCAMRCPNSFVSVSPSRNLGSISLSSS